MGSSDSLPLPSVPLDIGKWFSSYVYESPELNSIDDFKDSSGFIVAETEESPNESKQNLYGNIILTRSDDLLLDGKGNSDAFVNCKNHTINDNYTREVLEHSDSLSLGSEPPDIKKWFSSYVYESPVLDTSYEFGSDHKEEEAYEDDARSCSKEKEMTLSNLLRTGKDDFEGQNIHSDEPVKCIHFAGVKENEDPYIPEDNLKANCNQNSATPNDLMSWWNSDQILQKKRMQNQGNDGSAKDVVIAGSSLDKLSRKFSSKVSHVMLNIKSGSHKKSGKLAQESIPRRNLREDGSKAEDFTNAIAIVGSAENIECNRLDAKPVKKTGGSSDKENGTNLGENGFVSTRKSTSKRVDKENSFKRPFEVKSDPLKNGIIIPPCSTKQAINTKVLSETTNFQPSNAIEVTGKWRCPQKSKPNLGPPLKQLRLDQWIRRV